MHIREKLNPKNGTELLQRAFLWVQGETMTLAETQTKPVEAVRKDEKVCCPLCGGKMNKSDPARDTAKNASFAWHECTEKYCSGL